MNTSNTYSTFFILTKRFKTLFLLFSVMVLCTNLGAQVTIGSAIKPNDGALLDLKQYPSTTDGGATSNLGMLLPRVNLEAANSLKPTVDNPDPAVDNPAHEGLLVFNMATVNGLCPGLYVWNSTSWSRLYGSCQTMSATVDSKYVLDGSERTFSFSSAASWSAVIDDPDDILDETNMVLSGAATTIYNYKFQLKVVPSPSTKNNIATITFTDANGQTLKVKIVGEPVYLNITNPTWTAEVDADELSSVVTTNSAKAVKFSIPVAATWLTAAGNALNVTSNIGDAQRTSTATAYLDGLESVTALKKDVNVSQEHMTISIEVDWVVVKPLFQSSIIPEANRKTMRLKLDDWKWGGIKENTYYGDQEVVSPDPMEAHFYITTNSKKNISLVSNGPSGTSLDWINAVSKPTFKEEVAGQRIHIMDLGVKAYSNKEVDRTGDLKLKIDGGLEKDLHVIQSVISITYAVNNLFDNPYVDEEGGPLVALFHPNDLQDIKDHGHQLFFVNKQYIENYSIDLDSDPATVTIKLTPKQEDEDIDTFDGIKTGIVGIIFHSLSTEGKLQRKVMLTYALQLDDPFADIPDVIMAPVNGDNSAPIKFDIDTESLNSFEVLIPEQDKSWLSASIDSDSEQLLVSTTSLNLTGKDRETEITLSVQNANSFAGRASSGDIRTFKVVQEAIYLRADVEEWSAGVDADKRNITISSNAEYKLLSVAPLDPSVTWLKVKGVQMPAGLGIVLQVDIEPNLTPIEREYTVEIYVENKATGEKVTEKVKIIQPAMTLNLAGGDAWKADHDGDTRISTITTNSYKNITATPSETWVTAAITKNSTGNFTLKLDAGPNTTGAARTANVVLQIGKDNTEGLTKTISITQDPITLVLNPASWAVTDAGGTLPVTITTNSTKIPTATSNQTWLEVTMGTGSMTLVADPNSNLTARNAVVTVTVNGYSATLPITQSALAEYLNVSPLTWAAAIQGEELTVTATTNKGVITMTNATPGATWLTVDETTKKLKVTANTTGTVRTATVNVSNGNLSKSIVVTQQSMTLTVTPASWTAPVNGGSQAFTATTNHGTVTMTSNQGWLTKGADGITFTAAANTTDASRTATITVTNGVQTTIVTVTQAAMTLTVTPASWAVPVNGGSQAFTATTNHGTVTMTSNQGWLTKGADGITFTAAANTTAASRTATITVTNGVKSMTVNVTQAAMTLTVTPASWAVPVNGGTQAFTATTNHGTATLTSNAAWLVRAADGKTFTVGANTTAASRTATITVTNGVKSMTVNVTQAAMTLTVTPASWAVPVNGGTQAFTATTNHGTATLTSNAAWLVRAADGKTFTVGANTTAASRTATITVTNGVKSMTVNVTQAAMTLTVTPASWAVPVNGGTQAFTATTNHGTATLTSNAAWLVRAADGKTFTVGANTTAASRTATITVTNGVKSMTVNVTQAAMTLTVTPASWAVPVNGGTQAFTATTNHGTATLTSNAAWLVRAADGKTFTVGANTTAASRTATITVTNGVKSMTVNVTQAAMTLTVTPASWAVPVNGGTQAFTATTNHGTATLTSNAAWLVRAADGKTFTVGANTTAASRTATITVTNGVKSMTVNVTQAAMTLTVTPASWAVPVNGGTQAFTATTNHGTATLTSNAAWLVRAADGKTFTVGANTTAASRTATITVTNGVKSMTVNVTQAAMTLTVTPASWAVPVNGGTQAFTATTNHGTATLTSNAAWLVRAADGKTFTVGANTTAASRTATITVTNGVKSMTVNVTQAAMTLTVTPASWAVPVNGGTQAFTATTNHGTATLTSNAAWLVRAADGKTFTVGANTTAASRTATITVTNGVKSMTVNVTQAAMTLTVTPASWAVPVNGGTQAFTATTNHGTATLTSNAAWLVRAADGKTFTVGANTTAASRTATITVTNGVKSMTVNVTQAAMTLTVTPASWAVPVNGGTQAFTATTNHGTATLTSNAAWLVRAADGKTFTVGANTTAASRTATITVTNGVKSMTVNVTQAAMTLTVTPASWAVPVNGGTQAFTATTNHGTATLTSNAAWLVRAADGKTFTVGANTTAASRTATITVTNGVKSMTVNVTQAAMTLTVTPASWAVPVNGGTQAFTATTNHGTATLTSNAAWLVRAADGKTFTVGANTTAASRTATITVTNGVKSMTVNVTQAAMTLTVTPASWAVPVNGGTQAFTATTNHGTATLTSNAAWLVRAADGKTFTVGANTTAASRTATITVTNGVKSMTVNVTQAAMTLTVTPASWAVPVNGGTQAFTATTNHGTATLTSNAAWLVRAADGKTFTVGANTTAASRTATITVTNGVKSMTVNVTQAAMTLTVTPASWAVPVNGGTQAFTATTNHGTATLTSNAAWLVRAADGKTFTVGANTTAASRTATITVTNGVKSMTVNVTQAAMTLTVTPASWAVPVNGGTQAFTATTNHGTATLTSNAAWLVRAADGKTFTVGANTTAASRTATITVTNGVKSMTVNVTQAAMTLTVTPASWAAPVQGGNTTINPATNYGTLSVTSNATAWLTVGADKKTLTAKVNTTGAKRTGIITVSNGITALNKTVTVTQETMKLDVQATWTPPVNGGSTTIVATTNYGVTSLGSPAVWPTWLKRGFGVDNKYLSADANNTGASRSVTIPVTNGVMTKNVTITQEAMTLTVTPASWAAPVEGGRQTFKAASNYGGYTEMRSNSAWLKLENFTGGFIAEPNTTGVARTAVITATNGALTRTVQVTQATKTLTVTPADWKAHVDGGYLNLTTNYDNTALTLTSNATWVTVNNSLQRITAAQNTAATSRTAVVTVKVGTQTKTVKVTQEGLWVKIAGMPTSWKVPINGNAPTLGTYTVTTNSKTRNPVADVTYGANYKIQNRNLNWMMCSANSITTIGGSNTNHTLTVRANWYGNVTWGIPKTATLANRKATVTAKIGTVKAAQSMAVTQDGMYLTGSSPYVYLAYTGATCAWSPTTNGQTKTLWVKRVKTFTWKDADMHMQVQDWFEPADGKFYSKFTKVWAAANMQTIDFGLICFQQEVVATGELNMYYNGTKSPWNAQTNFRYVKGQSKALPVTARDGQTVAGTVDAPDFPLGDGGLEFVDEETGNILLIKRITLEDGTVKDYSNQPRRRVSRIE